MKKFLTRVFLFSAPFIFFLFPPILVLILSGESFTDIDKRLCQEREYLIGYAYDENNYKYIKWKEIHNQDKNVILAVGSSRILQFREQMFATSFYNAGYTVSSISDFVPFLESLEYDKLPKILLISLDQWMFNGNWDDLKNPETRWNYSLSKKPSPNTIVNVWKDLINSKYGLFDFYSADSGEIIRVGLNAHVNNKGLRTDGSMCYGDQIAKLVSGDSSSTDYQYHETFRRINSGTNRFEHGVAINRKALEQLNNLLMYCKEKKVYVIAILPPFATKVNDQMHFSGNYDYMGKIYGEALPFFQLYGFELWNMSNLSFINSNDSEMLDGFHGSEVVYLRILISMVKNGSMVKDYTLEPKLISDLENRLNNYSVY